jgi:hypothetical protein
MTSVSRRGTEPSTPAAPGADAPFRRSSPGAPLSADGKAARPQWVTNFAVKKGLFGPTERADVSPAPAARSPSIDARPEWDPYFAKGVGSSPQDAAPRSAKALSRQNSRRSSLSAGEREEPRGQQQQQRAAAPAAARGAEPGLRLVPQRPRQRPPTAAAAQRGSSVAVNEPEGACEGDSGGAEACDCPQADIFGDIFDGLSRLEDNARRLLVLAHCAGSPKFASGGGGGSGA